MQRPVPWSCKCRLHHRCNSQHPAVARVPRTSLPALSFWLVLLQRHRAHPLLLAPLRSLGLPVACVWCCAVPFLWCLLLQGPSSVALAIANDISQIGRVFNSADVSTEEAVSVPFPLPCPAPPTSGEASQAFPLPLMRVAYSCSASLPQMTPLKPLEASSAFPLPLASLVSPRPALLHQGRFRSYGLSLLLE